MRHVVTSIILITCALVVNLGHVSGQVLESSAARVVAEVPSDRQTTMPFKVWKERQVIEAQNRVARLANAIVLLEQKPNPKTLSQAKELKQVAEQLQIAENSVQITRELGLADYFAVYLNHFRKNPKALREVSEVMTAEEIYELLQYILTEREKNDIEAALGRGKNLPAAVISTLPRQVNTPSL